MKSFRAFITFIVLIGVPALLTSSCGSSSSPSSPSTSNGTGGGLATIQILGEAGSMSFSPSTLTVKAGQQFAWHNGDSIIHAPVQDSASNTGGNAGNYGGGTSNSGGFGTGDISPGSTSGSISMAKAGTFNYHCSIHPSMVGSIVVTN
jgi:plastocyanin